MESHDPKKIQKINKTDAIDKKYKWNKYKWQMDHTLKTNRTEYL